MTNILSLPLLAVTFETATNEDWRDSVAFAIAGQVVGYSTSSNTGTGTVLSPAVAPGAYIGDYLVSMTGASTYRVTDPAGYTIGASVVGLPFSASGLSFALGGSPAPADTFTVTVLPKPLDISGIRFVLQMRTALGEPRIVLDADTDDGTLVNGGADGLIGLAFPQAAIGVVKPSAEGTPYVVDIVAVADGVTRRCVTGTVDVVAGVTYQAA